MHKVRKQPTVATTDNKLFEQLRSLRKDISQNENVPPYIIFPDSTLREMSESCPLDREAMLAIKGVGERKFEIYGLPFLELLQKYAKMHDIHPQKAQSHEKKETNRPSSQTINRDLPSHVLSYNMYQAGTSMEDIAEARGLTLVTIQNHIIRCGLEGMALDWDTLIPSQYENLILHKIEALGTEKLRPIKDALPPDVDYLAIKAVLGKYNSEIN